MKTLSIDIETYSGTDIKKAGMYKYIADPAFEIILVSYRVDNGKIKTIELPERTHWPADFITMLCSSEYKKTAWNAAFEFHCFQKLFTDLKLNQWECTMTKAMMLSFPGSLDAAGVVLNLLVQKDHKGKALIKKFCIPNLAGNMNRPVEYWEDWLDFIEYNRTDVEVESQIADHISFFKFPEFEKVVWMMDLKINKRGVMLDLTMINNAVSIAKKHKAKCFERAIELTGLKNPNSTAQIKGWLESAVGSSIESLNKKALPGLKLMLPDAKTEEVVSLRIELSKSSVKKYDTMLKSVGKDSRARGLVQYYGASRTGRWAGRLIQVHNLPRNSMQNLDDARNMVLNNDYDGIEMMWDSPQDVLSQLLRTAFVAPEGKTLLCSDFSAIEACVTAWLAGEGWRLKILHEGIKDIYRESYSQMFKVPYNSIDKKSPQRQVGKVAELALGFGGGPAAMIRFGALDLGMEEKQLPKIVRMWRNASPKIATYWKEVNELAIKAVQKPGTVYKHNCGVMFGCSDKLLYITLPSGRQLIYQNPKLVPGKFDAPSLHYIGLNQVTKKWDWQNTYGGKITENIVQATARDLLAHAMVNLDKAGFKIVMHVHDEVIIEVPNEKKIQMLHQVNMIMRDKPDWAKGCPVKAESFLTKYYKKED